MPFARICKVIKKFKENALNNHANYTLNDNIRKQKSIVLQREEKLHEIPNDFHNLDYEVQINSVINFAFKIGNMKNILSISNYVENSSVRPVVTTESEIEENSSCCSDSD